MGIYKDIVGQRFGKLLTKTPIKIEGKAGMYWHCICDCGNESTHASNALISKRATSCGCNSNQAVILRYKKENPNATYPELVKVRIKAHTKWVNGCLEWTATLSQNGYGVFVYNKKTVNASRAVWIAHHGEPIKGLCVIHHCDNRKCCLLKHLALATHESNTYDMLKKGRDSWEGSRKFPIGTREKAWELRQSGKMYREIAKELNVTIDQIKSLLQSQKNKLKKCKRNESD